MAKSETKQSGGIGFLGMLTLIFITLKLTHYISWSWWLVLLPSIIPLCLVIIILLAAAIIAIAKD